MTKLLHAKSYLDCPQDMYQIWRAELRADLQIENLEAQHKQTCIRQLKDKVFLALITHRTQDVKLTYIRRSEGICFFI